MKKLKKQIAELISGKPSISDLFYEKSKNISFTKDANQEMPQEWITIHFKTYPRLKRIFLRNTRSKKINSLLTRRSLRSFDKKEIPIKLLSQLLLTSAGINLSVENIDDSRRPYPSAGARYPLEIYIVALRVKKLKEGVYHYNVKENSLEELLIQNMDRWILESTGSEKWILDATFLVIITGIPDRARIKYGERGFRHMLIEAGHLSQNICLLSESLGLGVCPLGGFIESKVASLLDIENIKEYPLYILAVGRKKE